MRLHRVMAAGLTAAMLCGGPALAKKPANCPKFNVEGDKPLAAMTIPPAGACKVQTKNGVKLPDPSCTPGAVNPSLTLQASAKRLLKQVASVTL
jgi:hypothetical protein